MKYSAPTYVPIEITSKCNLKCKHCYGGFPYTCEKELTTNDVCELIKELYDFGVYRIEIGGGEPTVRQDFIEIVKYALNFKDIDLSIVTNGILWSEDDMKELYQYSSGNLTIHISMDGYDEKSYAFLRGSENSFSKVLNNSVMMIKNGLDVRWNVAVGKETYSYLDKIIDLAYEIGIKELRLMVLYNTGRGAENDVGFNFFEFQDFMVNYVGNLRFNKKVLITLSLTQPFEFFIPLMEKGYSYEQIIEAIPNAVVCLNDNVYNAQTNLSCVGGRMLGAINSKGEFYFCCMLTSISKFAGGSLYNNSLEEIWNNNERFKWIRNLKLEDLQTNCFECRYKRICGGGCRARAYFDSGNFLGPDPLCPIAKYIDKPSIIFPEYKKEHILEDCSIKNNFKKNSFTITLRNKKVRVREEEFGCSVFIFPERYITANKSAFNIFKLFNEFNDIEKIISELKKIYNIDNEKIRAIILNFIDKIINF